MEIEYKIGCILCGVPKDKQISSLCDEDLNGHLLIKTRKPTEHIQTEIKIVHGWIWKGVLP